jgi:hypothetical protein
MRLVTKVCHLEKNSMRTDFNKAVSYLVTHASLSVDLQEPYIYIYIYRERERERERNFITDSWSRFSGQ